MPLDLDGRARGDRRARSRRRSGWRSRRPPGASTRASTRRMANAARVHALERGSDPRGLPVFVFGGAGPVHGFRVARALGAPPLIAPFGAGVMSHGRLPASRRWRSTSCARAPAPLDDAGLGRASTALLAEMEPEGAALLVRLRRAAGADHAHAARPTCATPARATRSASPWPGRHATPTCRVRAAFEAEYRAPLRPARARGRAAGGDHLARVAPARGPSCASSRRRRGRPAAARKGERLAWLPELGGMTATPVYDRYRLAPGRAHRRPGDRRGARVDRRHRARRRAPSSTSAGTSW